MSDLARLVARMFCIGFDGLHLPSTARRLLESGVGGAILFKRNIESARQVKALCAQVKSAGTGAFLSIDQEGGRVMRLREGFTPIPTMRAIGQTGDEKLAEAIGGILGREVRALDIDLNFAPVLDVDSNPANPVIGDRSFGNSPNLVGRMGCALIAGLQSAGVAACGKHFPGHGDTSQDSHVDLPSLPHAPERLNRIELPPFAAAARAGVASIMTAHVIFNALDPGVPATMSAAVLDGLLRKRLGFDGVVISDDLEMKAIADHFGLEETVTRGAQAGVDLFLVCHTIEKQQAAIEVLVKAVERGEVSRGRIEQSNRRLDHLGRNFVGPAGTGDLSVIGSAAHRAIISRAGLDLTTERDPTEWKKS